MTPGEVLIHIEEAQPKKVGNLSVADFEKLQQRREALEREGEKVW